jgi:hypothetical protein
LAEYFSGVTGRIALAKSSIKFKDSRVVEVNGSLGFFVLKKVWRETVSYVSTQRIENLLMIERRHKMRILYFFMVVCLVLTFGCAGMKPERTVLQDNVFYSSSSPRIKMKIHPDLKYIGKVEQKKHLENVDRTGGSLVETESYLFGHTEDRRILKGALIRIVTLRDPHSVWLLDVIGKTTTRLDSGDTKIHGRTYQYVVGASKMPFRKYEWLFFVRDKGYRVPSLLLVKVLGGLVGPDDKTVIYIYYMEDASRIQDREYSYGDWRNRYVLTNEQQEFMKGFVARSEENIQILGRKEVIVSREGKESPKTATRETAPPSASIDKVVIGVLDFEIGGSGMPGALEHKKAIMRELKRNPRVKLVDIHESCSLSDLKRYGFERAERYRDIYELDMILHVQSLRHFIHQIYSTITDLYTKKVKEESTELPRPSVKLVELECRRVSRKLLVSQDLNRVLRAKKEALGE